MVFLLNLVQSIQEWILTLLIYFVFYFMYFIAFPIKSKMEDYGENFVDTKLGKCQDYSAQDYSELDSDFAKIFLVSVYLILNNYAFECMGAYSVTWKFLILFIHSFFSSMWDFIK